MEIIDDKYKNLMNWRGVCKDTRRDFAVTVNDQCFHFIFFFSLGFILNFFFFF